MIEISTIGIRRVVLELRRRLMLRTEPAMMGLDTRGRLVANKAEVFGNAGIAAEIEAAKMLGEALSMMRKTHREDPKLHSDGAE